jgi:uncharacterized protein DUF6130
MRKGIRELAASIVIACLVGCAAPRGTAQGVPTAAAVRGAAALVPIRDEPPAKIIIDPPLTEPLSRGQVVIQYRTEHLRIAPVFGPAALAVSPRIGHIHVNVDDAPWVWADSSGEDLIIAPMPPGPHRIRIHLMDANHRLLDQGTVELTVPARATTMGHGAAAAQPSQTEPPPKILIDSPLAEPLARGVVFIRYRTENLQIVPVFGTAALEVSPRIGHIHVTVDGAAWHWADASGGPVIIAGLPPGPHAILIELVDANHHPVDQGTVEVNVPAAN